jgi:hypothetical protein
MDPTKIFASHQYSVIDLLQDPDNDKLCNILKEPKLKDTLRMMKLTVLHFLNENGPELAKSLLLVHP